MKRKRITLSWKIKIWRRITKYKLFKIWRRILNGEKWNEKVKEYNYLDWLQFEGKYLNGNIFKGKEYINQDELKYEGEYLDRKRHGKGKEFNIGR